jgi:hypothetical protein
MIASYAVRLVCLSLAVFLLVHTVLGAAVASIAPALVRWTERMRPRNAARLLLIARLSPAAAGLFVVLAFCIPSYLWLEPEAGAEEIGWLCVFAAIAAAALWGRAAVNLSRALLRSARYARYCERTEAPVLMLTGVLRQRLVVSRVIRETLTSDQLDAALRHEQAHRRAHDNFKRLLQAATPRLPGFAVLERAWSRISEWAADDDAVAGDVGRALCLADALVRVARLGAVPAEISFLGDGRDLAHRIERLLYPRTYAPSRGRLIAAVATVVSAIAIVALGPTLESAHRLLEQLVH